MAKIAPKPRNKCFKTKKSTGLPHLKRIATPEGRGGPVQARADPLPPLSSLRRVAVMRRNAVMGTTLTKKKTEAAMARARRDLDQQVAALKEKFDADIKSVTERMQQREKQLALKLEEAEAKNNRVFQKTANMMEEDVVDLRRSKTLVARLREDTIKKFQEAEKAVQDTHQEQERLLKKAKEMAQSISHERKLRRELERSLEEQQRREREQQQAMDVDRRNRSSSTQTGRYNRSSSYLREKKLCFQCKEPGHFRRDCPKVS